MLKYKFLAVSVFILYSFSAVAQNIRINEVVSSNSEYYDEDGDTPDWIELHNFGTTPVSLLNWGLTDDGDNLHDWQFPDLTLNADEYLQVWASKKNRAEVTFARTLVNQGDVFKYIVPNSQPALSWTALAFNDTSWLNGVSGFGYEDDDDATVIATNSPSVYARTTFTMANSADLTSLILDVDYDDGFVAYINGVEVARANVIGNPPAYNASTPVDHEAQMYNGGQPERFVIENPNSFLVDGENVLAIEGHNISNTSSDLTLIPFLTAIFSSSSTLGEVPPEILQLATTKLHTNFKISSTSETLFLSDENETIIDQLLVEGLHPNTSYGVSVASSNLVYYIDTTPGAINSNTAYDGILNEDIIFSVEGGLISEATINLALSGSIGSQEIRFTTDATEPTEASTLYTSPISISENSVIKAKLFDTNYLPSFTTSKSYIFNANHNIDVVFLTTDPYNLFDNDYGIYEYGDDYDTNLPYLGANFWEDWERPVHFAFYDKDSEQIEAEFNAGVKIFGGWSRANNQRSFSIFARGQYGTSEFEYPFFDAVDYDKFQALVLRNSGSDWLNTSILDAALTSLMQGSGLDFQAFNPVATYINDQYWGMYNLREKVNEHFLAEKHDVDADDIDLLGSNAEIIEGTNLEYNQLIDYVSTTDLSNDANFEYVRDRVDLENYAIYQTAQIYFDNRDWPGNNIKFWNHPEGKWRWILYDTDFGFGRWNTNDYNQNTLSFALQAGNSSWPNPDWSTLLFRNLMENINFRNQFINRYADELNTRFLPQHVKDHIDAVFLMVQPEIDAHYTRWGANPNNAQLNVNRMKTFADNRHAIVKEHIKSEFNLPDYHVLAIANPNILEGFVMVNNNLNIQETNWSGDYFETVPITVTAIAEEGFVFSHWSGASTSTEATIELSLAGDVSITPNFSVSALENLVINEINYKSGDVDADDWVELYNPNNVAIDVSNWILKDDNDTNAFVFPTGTMLAAESYLLLIKNEGDFNTVFPAVTNYIGEIGFGFGGSDSVRLYNSNNVLQDQVDYDDTTWAACADNLGPTLELISPELDNNIGSSWDCTNTIGSPGLNNDESLSVNEFEPESFKIYPNPFGHNSNLFIKGKLIRKVEIYTVLGEKLYHKSFNNSNNVELNIEKLNSGIYIIRVNEKHISKLIIK